jgi:hypothetical protein
MLKQPTEAVHRAPRDLVLLPRALGRGMDPLATHYRGQGDRAVALNAAIRSQAPAFCSLGGVDFVATLPKRVRESNCGRDKVRAVSRRK